MPRFDLSNLPVRTHESNVFHGVKISLSERIGDNADLNIDVQIVISAFLVRIPLRHSTLNIAVSGVLDDAVLPEARSGLDSGTVSDRTAEFSHDNHPILNLCSAGYQPAAPSTGSSKAIADLILVRAPDRRVSIRYFSLLKSMSNWLKRVISPPLVEPI